MNNSFNESLLVMKTFVYVISKVTSFKKLIVALLLIL